VEKDTNSKNVQTLTPLYKLEQLIATKRPALIKPAIGLNTSTKKVLLNVNIVIAELVICYHL